MCAFLTTFPTHLTLDHPCVLARGSGGGFLHYIVQLTAAPRAARYLLHAAAAPSRVFLDCAAPRATPHMPPAVPWRYPPSHPRPAALPRLAIFLPLPSFSMNASPFYLTWHGYFYKHLLPGAPGSCGAAHFYAPTTLPWEAGHLAPAAHLPTPVSLPKTAYGDRL